MLPCLAQTSPPNEFWAVFGSYQSFGHPAVTGSLAYAIQAAPGRAPGTFAAFEYNIVPVTLKPFVLQAVARGGICQQVHDWPLRVFTCGQMSLNTTGAGVAGQTGGGLAGSLLADYPIGKTKWGVVLEVVGMKSSLSDPGISYELGIRRSRN